IATRSTSVSPLANTSGATRTSDQDARARSRLRHCARWTEPLEFWWRHALALRTLGVARHSELCCFSSRRRPHLDLLDGWHAHRSDAEGERYRRCPPVARRPLRRGDDRADQGVGFREEKDRSVGSRSPLPRLSTGQPIQCVASRPTERDLQLRGWSLT